MAHSGHWVRYSSRFCITSLTAAAALLAGAVPSTTAAATDLAPRAAVDVTGFSTGWSNPWAISFLPDGRSALVTENESARVYRLRDNGSRTLIGKVPKVAVLQPGDAAKGGLLGVAPSPTWDGRKDKQVFFMHTTATGSRVVRMDYDGKSLSGYKVVLGGLKRGSNHHGGKIAFGPDKYLYVATGEATHARLAQDKTSLNGKILRITKSGKPAPGNPFGNHVYSYGHRNPQGLAWDRKGRLWSVEIGQEAKDELNLIKPGANYGWPGCEGVCHTKGMTDPKATWDHTTAPAQVAVVGDDLYVSTLRGYQLWRVPITAALQGRGDSARTKVFSGYALRALAKVPGRNELWLGTARQASGDRILRVTVDEAVGQRARGAPGTARPSRTAPRPDDDMTRHIKRSAPVDAGAPAGAKTLSKGWHTPWGISFLPNGRTALVTERLSYQVYRLDRNGTRKWVGEVPYTVPEPYDEGAGGLLGVAPSPTWDGRKDKQVFFVHTTKSETRVVRMDYDGTSLRNYKPILTGIRRGGDHNGGRIAFGPDKYLYVTTGEALQPKLAQDKSSLNGKILRITKSGKAAPGNPFGNHVYSYGHRNPQGLAWDRKGRLWSVEIGQQTHDELNLIKRGANYGWPGCEGVCSVKGMTGPKATFSPEKGVPAQLAVVRNVLYVSSLRGQRLWRVPIDGDSERLGAKTAFYPGTYGRLRAIAKVPGANELWVGTSDLGYGNDKILRVPIR
ncbi:PQQ-dependent sugar dehydrogenase [Streptomyces sp. bgisy027]|uniref:PQQ-dependent sugar dehydrogenase n=1 Tax=unclassified Streptomyces TaxID=2593676 RepID=UPI003D744DAC